MRCIVPDCDGTPAKRGDVFCESHWRRLPRWARLELLKWRNEAARGGKAARTAWSQATTAAVYMLTAAPASPVAAGETPPAT